VHAAEAAIRHGELTIVLPKRADRRGRTHRIEVRTDGTGRPA
jgi:hypothetical protein